MKHYLHIPIGLPTWVTHPRLYVLQFVTTNLSAMRNRSLTALDNDSPNSISVTLCTCHCLYRSSFGAKFIAHNQIKQIPTLAKWNDEKISEIV